MTALAPTKSRASNGTRVLLHGVSWNTYERLLNEHDESAGPRFTFDDGFLEIMTLSIEHESPNRTLASLVELVLAEWNVDFEPAGSNTFKSEALQKGFEPDTCFYIGDVAAIRGRKRLDLAVDRPPDLVIEIEITEALLPKLPIFAAVRVPEVWVCDGQRVRVLHLERGRYRELKRSRMLAPITAAVITDFLRSSSRMKRPAWTRAVRKLAQAQRR